MANVKPSNEHAWVGHSELRERIDRSPLLRTLNNLRMLVSANSKRDRFIIKHLRRHARALGRPLRVLDVGCGGGRLYLKQFGEIFGVEPDEELRRNASRHYVEVKPGLANDIPFPSESFDVVMVIDVFGHIEEKDKDASIAEMLRALRPGGIFVGFIECNADNFWYRIAKQRPDLFEKYFVDRLGHFGLETATATDARYRRAGVETVEVRPIDGVFSSVGYLQCLFGGTEYLQQFPWLRPLVAGSRLLGAVPLVAEILNCLLCPVSVLVDHMTKPDNCSAIMTAYRKPARK